MTTTPAADTEPEIRATPGIGEWVDGLDIPVVNERTVRAAAGLLFLAGIIAFMTAAFTENLQPLQSFAIVFMFDMLLRLFVSARWAPSMLIGGLIVRRQRPEWVGAAQKQLAWSLGLGLAVTSCLAMGLLALDPALTLVLCGFCLSLLFLETAFGICVGCLLHQALSKTPPRLCPGDTCSYTPPARGEAHSVTGHAGH
ncbi:MAG: DUF4395 domain-containing protein [Cryobacterium sp.]